MNLGSTAIGSSGLSTSVMSRSAVSRSEALSLSVVSRRETSEGSLVAASRSIGSVDGGAEAAVLAGSGVEDGSDDASGYDVGAA